MTKEEIIKAYKLPDIELSILNTIKEQRNCDNDLHALFFYVWFQCGSILNDIGEDWTDLLSFVSITKNKNNDGYFYYMEDDDYAHFMSYWDTINEKIKDENKCYFIALKNLTINTWIK